MKEIFNVSVAKEHEDQALERDHMVDSTADIQLEADVEKLSSDQRSSVYAMLMVQYRGRYSKNSHMARKIVVAVLLPRESP